MTVFVCWWRFLKIQRYMLLTRKMSVQYAYLMLRVLTHWCSECCTFLIDHDLTSCPWFWLFYDLYLLTGSLSPVLLCLTPVPKWRIGKTHEVSLSLSNFQSIIHFYREFWILDMSWGLKKTLEIREFKALNLLILFTKLDNYCETKMPRHEEKPPAE